MRGRRRGIAECVKFSEWRGLRRQLGPRSDDHRRQGRDCHVRARGDCSLKVWLVDVQLREFGPSPVVPRTRCRSHRGRYPRACRAGPRPTGCGQRHARARRRTRISAGAPINCNDTIWAMGGPCSAANWMSPSSTPCRSKALDVLDGTCARLEFSMRPFRRCAFPRLPCHQSRDSSRPRYPTRTLLLRATDPDADRTSP